MKKIVVLTGSFIFSCFLPVSVTAHESGTKEQLKLVKNLGQHPRTVLYSAELNGGAVFLERAAFTYVFYNAADLTFMDGYLHQGGYFKSEDKEPILRGHAYKVKFKNANANPHISESGKCSEYYNYLFGQNESEWFGNVPLYSEVVYSDIYPGIELKVFSSGARLKYDFIVNAGADASKIQMNFKGTDGLQIENGNLLVSTSVSTIVEQKPFAYQVINGRTKNILCEYRLHNNNVTFHFPQGYDKRYQLIIDPVVIASTYSGTTYRAYGHTAAYDNAGNIYSAGRAFSVNTNGSGAGYPATVGAFQTTHAGGFQDICISKYSPDGSSLIWASYIGGSGQEQPHSMVVDANQQLYIYGSSNSGNYPVSATGYQRTNPTDNFGNRLNDIVVTKLNAAGSALLGSTYVGGRTENDGYAWSGIQRYYGDYFKGEIVIDSSGNAYVASYGRSADFPVTSGAVQTTYGGGYQDGVVFKLNSNLSSLVWSTFLGGPGEDACYGLKLDANGNIFVTGAISSNILTNTAGTIHTSYIGGLFDAYVAHISANGQTFLKSTYFGSVSEEQAYLLDLDAAGNVYIFGATPNSAIQPTPGTYQGVMSGSFIAKLKSTLDSVRFITTFNQLAPTALMVDECNYIYAMGHGGLNTSIGNLSGFQTTPDAFQTGSGGFYMLTLEPDATALKFGSYFGPQDAHVDGGTCRFDRRGVIYHALCTDKTTLVTTPNAYRTTKSSNDFDNCVFKVDFQAGRVEADAVASISGSNDTSAAITSCALPVQVQFINRSVNALQFTWHFGNGDSSLLQHPVYTFDTIGNYSVMLIARDAATCNKADTAYITVNLANSVALSVSSTSTSCNNNFGSATVSVAGGLGPFTYLWSNNSSDSTITNLPSGNYAVTVTASNNCSASASAMVVSSNGVTLTAVSGGTTCGGNNGTASVTATTGASPFVYAWSNGGNTASLSGLVAGTYTATVTDANNCSATVSVMVDGSVANAVNIVSDKAIMCSGDSARICAPSGYVTYLWNTGQTDSCIYTKLAGNYYVTVTEANTCTIASNHVAVSTYPLPPVSVTVNGDTLTAYNAVTYQWFLNNAAINGATSPVYIAQQSGDYTVAVTDSNGCRAVSTKINVLVSGLAEANDATELVVYPNPFIEKFEMKVAGYGWKQPLTATLFDATGRKVYDRKLTSSSAAIDVSILANGVYMLEVEGKGFTAFKKLVKE